MATTVVGSVQKEQAGWRACVGPPPGRRPEAGYYEAVMR